MNYLINILSMILGTNKEDTKSAVDEMLPEAMPFLRLFARIILFVMFLYCLYKYTIIAVIIAALVYFIIQLEQRVFILEKEIEIERRLNREAYSTERYTARPGYGKQNQGNPK